MMAERDPEWEAMFDLQYDLIREIDALIQERTKPYPPLWRAVVQLYIVEHLGERARFDIELPPRPVPIEETRT